jgi:hypothetical protein
MNSKGGLYPALYRLGGYSLTVTVPADSPFDGKDGSLAVVIVYLAVLPCTTSPKGSRAQAVRGGAQQPNHGQGPVNDPP